MGRKEPGLGATTYAFAPHFWAVELEPRPHVERAVGGHHPHVAARAKGQRQRLQRRAWVGGGGDVCERHGGSE